ncbi:uncharacterized protein LOC135249377 isoform X5 [Anguilla rostrata]|uniref:uncharacterized protein LOC135249377 isoform X5 n=1 Tax=Anguilla rostrata TaxID=7938 RepID=UPI0030D06259
MGALFFLLLAVLGVLLFRSRTLRRAPLHEAVYEEIEYKLARGGTYSAPRWGRGLAEDPPSGHADVGDGEGHSLSGDHVTDTEENYDDAVTLDWIQVRESVLAESPPAPSGMDYDDVGE